MAEELKREQLDHLASSISSLRSGAYADFSIRCSDDSIIPAHCAIVCPRSKVIAAALDGRFTEGISKVYHIDDFEPQIVVKMVDFLYSLDYDDKRGDLKASQESHDSPFKPNFAQQPIRHDKPPGYDPIALVINAKVYVIAEKYDIQDLKKLACAKYKEVWPKAWNSSSFVESASLVYENTVDEDKMLRDVIVKAATDNIRTLLARGEFVDVLRSYGDLATDVLKNVVNPPASQETESPWGSCSSTKKNKRKNHP